MQRRVLPKMEEVIRGMAVILLLVAMPFVILWNLLLKLVAPNFTAKRSAARRAHLDQIRAWQRQQLADLRAKGFTELSALPTQTPIAPPPQFIGERFAILRAPGDNGGVEVGVAHFMRTLGVILGRITPSFEMLPDGSIVEEPSSEPDD